MQKNKDFLAMQEIAKSNGNVFDYWQQMSYLQKRKLCYDLYCEFNWAAVLKRVNNEADNEIIELLRKLRQKLNCAKDGGDTATIDYFKQEIPYCCMD